jgi:hypothetical protein
MSSHCINPNHNHGHHPKMDCHFVEHVPVANMDMLRAKLNDMIANCERISAASKPGDIEGMALEMLRLLDGETV